MANNRDNRNHRQNGLALVTAMLVVAIAATTAAYLSIDQQIWFRQSENLTDRSQAEVVRAGALDWAITILAKDAKQGNSDDLTEDWAKKLPVLPVEGGQVSGEIVDAQGKFNLNNLLRNNQPSPPDIGAFRKLLESSGLDPNLTDAVLDWLDSESDTRPAGAEDIDYLQMNPPYRAANQPLQSIDELRLIRGFTEDAVDKLRPWIVALPQPTEINVNTAPKEVLAAVFYTLPASAIDSLVSQRPFPTQEKLSSVLQELAGGKPLPQAFAGTKSSYFEVSIETQFGRYQGSTLALIYRGTGQQAYRQLWLRKRLPGWDLPNSGASDNPEKPVREKL